MTTVRVIDSEGGQTIRLPQEFRVAGEIVSIRKDGEASVLELIRPAVWLNGFFEEIRIDDLAFSRPAQGQMPPAPSFT